MFQLFYFKFIETPMTPVETTELETDTMCH